MVVGDVFFGLLNAVGRAIDGPITWWKESVVAPNQKQYNWYHRQYRRVPTVDQCYTDDNVCLFEANMQFMRDRGVESELLSILQARVEQCVHYHGYDGDVEECRKLQEIYEENAGNWFCKYGDLGAYGNAKEAYMKQKHRLIWERRHGPVGSGMKQKE